ncbi:MAG TPA: hypothetical protein VF550_08245 [Polyangia bacterium]
MPIIRSRSSHEKQFGARRALGFLHTVPVKLAGFALLAACSAQIETLPPGPSGGGGQGGGAPGGSTGVAIHLDASAQGGAGGSGTSLATGNCANTVGWTCNLPDCADPDVATTITGKVYDPAGKNPIYGAVVYIPNDLSAITSIPQGPGNSCGTCVVPQGSPLAGAVTAADGSFTIKKAPVGAKVPLVVQVGKWRRMTTIAVNNQCAANAITDVELTRLPRSQTDGEKASMPKIAIAVGDADRLQCLFTRMGVDAHEFTNPGGTGAINLYNLPSALNDSSSYRGAYDANTNGGTQYPDAGGLWGDINQLAQYDVLLLACGGNQSATNPAKTSPNPISDAAKANMVNYLAHGGRAFAEHYHWAWIKSFPTGTKTTDLPIPSPLGVDVATWIPYDSSNVLPSTPALVETSFPKGKDFAQWLLTVGATSTLGTMTFDPTDTTTKPSAKDELATPPSARRWIYQPEDAANPSGPAAYTHYLSFNVSSTGQVIDRLDTSSTNMCGRFVYTGLHVAAAASGAHAPDSKSTFPSQCQSGDLSPYEKAIEFMLFDLSSCLTPDQSTVGQTIIF